MKTIKLFIIALALFFSGAAKAQVSVNVNIGSPPMWGPAGYSEVRYYYLPDVEAYYDVHTSMFIYLGGGVWVHRAHLPSMYSSYDLYGGYKVVMVDYHGNSPYHNHNHYKVKYKKGYKGSPQKTIGAKPGKGNSKAKPASKGPAHKHEGPKNKGGNGNDKGGSPGKNKGKGGGGKKN